MSIVTNAIVTDQCVRLDRGCFLSVWLTLDYGGSVQGFGGWVLGATPDAAAGKHAEQPNLAAEWVVSVLRVCGVEDLAACVGKAIRVRLDREFGSIEAIGHITKDVWFDPKAAMAALKKEEGK